MSSQVGLGIPIPVPQMLPVTGTWTLPFAGYLSFLAHRVVLDRLNSKKWVGDRSSPGDDPDKLEIDGRSHKNFLENVPLAIALSAIAELNGANRRVLNYALAALFVVRVLHVEAGIKRPEAMGNGRPVGFWGTQAFIVGISGYTAWLVKAYWGF